eukprot:SM000097S24746  [mRNA]  locus=s97:81777:83149:+ [translate_table: standard]
MLSHQLPARPGTLGHYRKGVGCCSLSTHGHCPVATTLRRRDSSSRRQGIRPVQSLSDRPLNRKPRVTLTSSCLRRQANQHESSVTISASAQQENLTAAQYTGLVVLPGETIHALDDVLSTRQVALDPAGYFVISVDREARLVIADHYCNLINAEGLACDPDTGEVIPCTGYKPRPPTRYRGRSAKELSVQIIERTPAGQCPVSMLTHANYLGREFQKAEAALLSGTPYVQD